MHHLGASPSEGTASNTAPLRSNPSAGTAQLGTGDSLVAVDIATEPRVQHDEIPSTIANPMVRVDVVPENSTFCGRADWATYRLGPTEGAPRMSALKCRVASCPIDFVLLCSVTMLGAIYGAVALPLVLTVILIDVAAILLTSIPAAAYLVYAFVTSPRYGRNLKLCGALILPATVVCSALVYAVLWPVVCVVLTFAMGVIQMMGGKLLPVAVLQWVIGDSLELCVMFPFLWDTMHAKVRKWRSVLADGETVYDVRLASALSSLFVVFIGGITGLVAFIAVALVFTVPAFCAGVRVAAWCVCTSPRICQLIAFPLAITWLIISGPAWAGIFLVGCPVAGLFSGVYALRSLQAPETPVQAWKRAMREMFDLARSVSVEMAMKGAAALGTDVKMPSE